MQEHSSLRSLSNDDILSRFAALVQRDHRQVAASLRYIDEIDRRELWARYGHSSMFAMCVDRFRMSEDVAGKRIGVSRVARRFPLIFEMIERGDISLSAVLALKAHLTEENHPQVLAEAKHKKMKEIDRLIARIAPKPDVPTRVTAVPQPRSAAAASDAAATQTPELDFTLDSQPAPPAQTAPPASPEPPQPQPPARAPDPTPLSERRFKLVMTMSEEAHASLERLQDLLAHQIPNGDPAQIVERALEVLLAETLKKKAALTESPRTPTTKAETKPRTRAIPAHVRRAVWERDRGRCTFVGDDGRQCGETRGLEFAHGEAYAKGGEHTVGNIFLRCRSHNTHEAHRDYGRAFMDRKRSSSRPDHVREALVPYAALRRSGHDAGANRARTRRAACENHIEKCDGWRARTTSCRARHAPAPRTTSRPLAAR